MSAPPPVWGNTWEIGTQYDKNWNSIAWQQSGPFELVYPQQPTGNSDLFTTLPFNSKTGTYIFGCGHSVDQVALQLDYDFFSQLQVMLVMCPTCSYISRVISPASLAYNPLTEAVITP